ncbi:MAG: SusC/RagA family TonB-linked outer membrane protein [Paludibacter sp.]|nr:SusC/RagA family TonB-linked outer membrane protein [Paludibacter sp.]
MTYKIKYSIRNTALIGILSFTFPFLNVQSQVNPYITSAISDIDAVSVEKNSLKNIEQSLNGTISGLYSISNGGQNFGLANYNFFLRGKTTTGDNTPLILVDGIDANIHLLDPNEIESIEVLKDAAELAMYGLRGANGVILIKTKKGNATKNFMKIDLRYGLQTPIALSKKLNAYEYASLHNEANINDGANQVYQPDKYLNTEDSFRYPDTNLPQDFLNKNAAYNHYNFTAGGGNEIAQYYALISYMKQDGLFALPKAFDGLNQTYNERYNFRTNLDVNLGKGFLLNTNISAVFDDRRSPWLSSSDNVNNTNNYIFNAIMNTPANAFPLTNPDGSLGGTAEYRDNPIGLLKSGIRIENTRKLTANVSINKNLSEWINGLSAFIQYNFENYNAYFKGNYTTFAVNQLKDDDTYVQYGADDTKVSTAGGQMSDYYSDMTFNAGSIFEKHIGKHQIHASLIYNQYTSFGSGDTPAYKWLGTASRLFYGYDNRYFAQISGSYQGSNNYISGKRFGLFPAASLAWVVSEEDFLKENEAVDYLKTRASVGLTGNDKTGGSRFMHRQAFYNGGGYGFGNPNGTSQGSYEGTLGNPDATWEEAAKMNIGIDFRTLKNKLSLTMDYFYENRQSILVNQANITPALIGISLAQYNAGIIHNQGIEGDLKYSHQIGPVIFHTGLNFLYAKNKIIDLKETNYPEKESYRYRKGNPVNALFGFVSDGIYNDESAIQEHGVISSYGQIAPGDIKYLDQNEDGIINDADKKVIGNTFPEFIYGINVGIEVKGFDMYLQVEGSEMFDVHLRPNQLSVYAYENRWTNTQSGANASYPRLSFTSDHNTQTSSFWLDKGHLFRLSTVDFGYSLPDYLVKKVAVSNIRFYVKMHNILSTINSREGRDLEALNAGFTTYPAMKTAVIGISVNL